MIRRQYKTGYDRRQGMLLPPRLDEYVDESNAVGAIEAYVEREVLPYIPDAWVDEGKTRIGYEIPFSREFYEYTRPRPLELIEAEITELEDKILELIRGTEE